MHLIFTSQVLYVNFEVIIMSFSWNLLCRLPRLPVGVECTLGLLQACIRDREWTPMINSGKMSMTYENDLRMMYSTVIMKFINHISNIAHKKQTSLFAVAKQLNIPDWIVDLRHDTAHGHELPSIDVMRIVANILLTWLHVNNSQITEPHFIYRNKHFLNLILFCLGRILGSWSKKLARITRNRKYWVFKL